jgi:acyl-CoA synthetase (AMP-forming)/AMP-acid ligase II
MRLEHFLEASAARDPAKTALVCGSRRASFGELEGEANALSHALIGLGLRRQERVAIQFDNSFETVQGIFATLKAAGIFVVINPQVKDTKLAFILDDCGASVLLIGRRGMLAALNAISRANALRHVVLLDADPVSDPQLASPMATLATAGKALHGLGALTRTAPTEPPPNPNIDLDLASLIYTSGSTGRPKGVMLTHHNMVTAASALTDLFGNTCDDVVLSTLPLSFNYGLYQALMLSRHGGTLVLERQFTYPAAYVELIVRERVTGLPIVPTLSAILIGANALASADLSSVRYITNTAQALPEAHIRALRQAMPAARIFSMYGLTECKRAAYLPPEWIDRKPGSVGVPMPNTEAWLEDEAGHVIDTPNVVGELVTRGTHVMAGYWNRTEESAAALKPGRYPFERVLKTGDLFRKDADGHFYFVSRKDDLIKTAGERVGPREVEDALHDIPGIEEAVVIGIPDEVLGQAIKAFVVLQPGVVLKPADIIRQCQARLERHMVPKLVEILDTLPRTATGKISRAGLS